MHFKTSADAHFQPRYSGILVHPTSFPSPYGIGDLGQGAYAFIDFLEKAGQHLWQILPLVPTTFGNSPYSGYSVFAGNPLLISPERLGQQGLLQQTDLEDLPNFDPLRVDFAGVTAFKNTLFEKAYQAFLSTSDKNLLEEYDSFCESNWFWLDSYCLFMAGKDYHQGKPWTEWEASLRNPTEADLADWSEKLQALTGYHRFLQYIFYSQWHELKAYANEKQIAVIGDLPIFVCLDSADIWAHKHLFKLDDRGYPTEVAGVPPDYFCKEGQLWGNPLYDWEAHEAENFRWWISRIANQTDLADYLRLDHFRGFEACWSVPADAATAVNGTWRKAPGEKLFTAVKAELGGELPLFAEDLGLITPEVEKLRDTLGFPGMRVLQFAFDGGESTFLPHQFDRRSCVCYTGTHDNDTTVGWYQSASEYARDKVRRYMNTDASSISWDFIRICLGTIARYAIFPLQDVLKLGSEARMNVPGVPSGNWTWRYRAEDLSDGMAQGLKQLTELFGR